MTTGTALVFKNDGVRVVGPLHQSLACAVHASLLEGAVYGVATAELFDEPVPALTLLRRPARVDANDIDRMRDVYMSREQRAAYERILAAANVPQPAAHAWIDRVLSNKDWVGPASHFKPDEEVIQTRVLRSLAPTTNGEVK